MMNHPLPGTVWIQLPSATPSGFSGPRWMVVDPSALARRPGWVALAAGPGEALGVCSIDLVSLSYGVSDQKRASGMSGGSVTW